MAGNQNRRAVYKTINGVKHKLCTGPAHREGKFVPISNYFMRGDDKTTPRAQCKQCESIQRGSEKMMPYSEIQFAVNELIYRLGKAETARRLGIKAHTLSSWTNGSRRSIHRRNARAIISTLAEVRAKGEVRHKKSIKHGASARGKEERQPRWRDDFNGPNNGKTEIKRVWTHKLPREEMRRRWRETKRRQAERKRLTEAA